MKKLLLTLAAFFAVSPIFADVRPVPLPEGEPASGFWALSADDQEVGVYTARTADPPFERYDYGGEYAFASLDADSPVRLKIRNLYGASLKNLTIRPQSLGLKPENVGDDSFELVVPKSCRFSVETNGREHPLLVFVNPPERDVPAADAENVVYYGPGVHDVGKIALGSNQTLYLAAGALVKGGIDACGENIKIRGRGVLDSTPWEWPKGPTGHVVHMHESKNVSIEGIIVRGAS
ncbi:MAG: hypothetical protein HUK22_03530, partial [Thermoguttaceae bacterium]|nr:hypothetical protein [Thermoguttaceae bacterium]